MRRAVGLVAALVSLAGCTKDLTSQPIIGAAPAPRAADKAPAAAASSWRKELCLAAGDGARGTLTFAGECNFAVPGPALCRPEEDDFYVLVKRTLAGGQSFNFYVNVERHHGAGEYAGEAQLHVSVRDGATLYRWSNFTGTLTLAGDTKKSGDGASVTLRGMRLAPEPGTPARGMIVVDGTIACVQSMEPAAQ